MRTRILLKQMKNRSWPIFDADSILDLQNSRIKLNLFSKHSFVIKLWEIVISFPQLDHAAITFWQRNCLNNSFNHSSNIPNLFQIYLAKITKVILVLILKKENQFLRDFYHDKLIFHIFEIFIESLQFSKVNKYWTFIYLYVKILPLLLTFMESEHLY